MSFSYEMIANVRHALFGTITPRTEAENIATRLGSRQEFLASLIVDQANHTSLSWLRELVSEIAQASVVSASTRRTERDYPQRQATSALELGDVLKRLIEVDCAAVQPIAEQAYTAFVKYGSLNLPGDEHIRYSLATNIR